MNQTRRALLSGAAGVGLAAGSGCLGVFDASSSLPGVDASPEPLPDPLSEHLSPDVDVLEGFTADHPARIRVSVSRLAGSDAPGQLRLEFADTPPFSYYIGGGEPPGTVLFAIPDDRSTLRAAGGVSLDRNEWVPSDPAEDCWRAPAPPVVRSTPTETNVVELAPGETVSHEYTLLGFAGEECIPELEYRFTSPEPLRVATDAGKLWQADWDGEDEFFPSVTAFSVSLG